MEDIFFGSNKFIGPLTFTLKCGRGGKGTKTVNALDLPVQSQQVIIVECKHGQRKVRWNRRYQMCRECCSEQGIYSTCKPGRVITWGDKISEAKKGVEFTEEHKKALSIAQYGIEESEWKGFYNKSEVAKIRDSMEYREFRQNIMKRDNFECQLTGLKGRLEVHHLTGVSTDASGILDLNNVITLHEKIHNLFHSKYGNKKNTLEQFEEFKAWCKQEPDTISSWLKKNQLG